MCENKYYKWLSNSFFLFHSAGRDFSQLAYIIEKSERISILLQQKCSLEYHHPDDFRLSQAAPIWRGQRLLSVVWGSWQALWKALASQCWSQTGAVTQHLPFLCHLGRWLRLAWEATVYSFVKGNNVSPTMWGYGVSGSIHKSPKSSPGMKLYSQQLVAVSFPFFSFVQCPWFNTKISQMNFRLEQGKPNLARVQMVTDGVTLGFVMVDTSWPQVFRRKS